MIRSAAGSDGVVSAVRAFNRFYTRKIGVLDEGLLKTRFSLAEVRVLYELAHREQPAASELAADLGLDAGYLSRMLTRFKGLGYLSRRPSQLDARQSLLSLTAKGKSEFDKLNARSNREIEEMLASLSVAERAQLTSSMEAIERLLDPASHAARSVEAGFGRRMIARARRELGLICIVRSDCAESPGLPVSVPCGTSIASATVRLVESLARWERIAEAAPAEPGDRSSVGPMVNSARHGRGLATERNARSHKVVRRRVVEPHTGLGVQHQIVVHEQRETTFKDLLRSVRVRPIRRRREPLRVTADFVCELKVSFSNLRELQVGIIRFAVQRASEKRFTHK